MKKAMPVVKRIPVLSRANPERSRFAIVQVTAAMGQTWGEATKKKKKNEETTLLTTDVTAVHQTTAAAAGNAKTNEWELSAIVAFHTRYRTECT